MTKGIQVSCEVETRDGLVSETSYGAAVEAVVDEDIKKFNDYFQSLGNDRLTVYETAAIKTYLHYRLFPPKSDEPIPAVSP